MRVEKSALVPYSARQMYDLVNDIPAYAEFLPWCRRSWVDETHDDGLTASVEIARGAVHKTFTTRNHNVEGESIEMKLIEGPFRHLHGTWHFQALDEKACKVVLDMDFDFSNTVVRMAFGPVFTQIVDKLVDSFCKRASDVY